MRFDSGIVGMDKIKRANGDALLRLMAEAGNLHLICGPIHRTLSGITHGLSLGIFKSRCRRGVLAFAATPSRLSSNEPVAYAIALLAAHGIIIRSDDVRLPDAGILGG